MFRLASRPGGSGFLSPCSSLLRLVAASPPAREARVVRASTIGILETPKKNTLITVIVVEAGVCYKVIGCYRVIVIELLLSYRTALTKL